MPLLVDLTFAETFTFQRTRLADYIDAAGEPATATYNEPRFDHSAEGLPRGLLVESAWPPSESDVCRIQRLDWDGLTADRGTVLHEYETAAGSIRRRAWYARRGEMADIVDVCLNTIAHHRLIAAVPVFLANRGGEVRWRDRFYELGGVLMADDVYGLAEAADTHPIIEG